MANRVKCHDCGNVQHHDTVEQQNEAAKKQCPKGGGETLAQLGPEKLQEAFSIWRFVNANLVGVEHRKVGNLIFY